MGGEKLCSSFSTFLSAAASDSASFLLLKYKFRAYFLADVVVCVLCGESGRSFRCKWGMSRRSECAVTSQAIFWL